MGSLIKNKSIFFLIFSVLTFNTHAAKRESRFSGNALHSKIEQEQKTIDKLKKQIIDIENKLTTTNKRFIFIENEKTQLDAKIYDTTLSLQKIKDEVLKKIQTTNKIINSLVVTSLNKSAGNENIIQRKLLKKVAQLKAKELSKQLNQVSELEKEINSFKTKLNDSYDLAGELAEFLTKMEAQKKLLANNYLEKVKTKEELESEYKKYQLSLKKRKMQKPEAKKVVNADIKMRFLSPLTEFTTKEHDQEGVTYKFQGNRLVRGPQNGKVVFSGPLANYGNVVVLDHGNNTRSVIWGNFKPQVLKSDLVKKGQLIGKASSHNKGSGSLYFEVRHKKQVQNTINLIEKERYSRNNNSVKQLQFEGT